MARDPAKISHAAELVVRVDVEDVFDGHGSTEKETTDRVHDALGFTSRAGGLHRCYVRHLQVWFGGMGLT